MTACGQIELVGLANHCRNSFDIRWTDLVDSRFHLQRLKKHLQVVLMPFNSSGGPKGVITVPLAVLLGYDQRVERVRFPQSS